MSLVDLDILFAAAIGLWNRALDVERHSLPANKDRWGGDDDLPGPSLGIDVYDDNAERPIAHFCVRTRHGLIEPATSDGHDEVPLLKISRRELEQLVADREVLIRNPRRLSLDWLQPTVVLGNGGAWELSPPRG